MQNEENHVWNSIQLYEEYKVLNGNILSNLNLVTNLETTFGDELLLLSTPGYANIVDFKNAVSNTLRMYEDETDDKVLFNQIAKKVHQETTEISQDKRHYNILLHGESASDLIRPTLIL